MIKKQIILIGMINLFLVAPLSAETKIINPYKLRGNWHLRIMDGMEVRKARAILDFVGHKKLSGFDGCNRISGVLQKNSKTNTSIPTLMATRMGCRGSMFRWTSQHLHETLEEGFYIVHSKRNGVKGITLKSANHMLFFAKMHKKEK